MTDSILTILKEPDRMVCCDKLGDHIVRVRQKQQNISPKEANALYQAQFAEANRHPFNGAIYERLWVLVTYCPPNNPLKQLAELMLEAPNIACRGMAISYLLRAYPDNGKKLTDKYDQDPDPEVQDAIARFDSDVNSAIARWERILWGEHLSHTMAETIPMAIAYAYPYEEIPQALAKYEEADAKSPWGSVWGLVAGAIRQRVAEIEKNLANPKQLLERKNKDD